MLAVVSLSKFWLSPSLKFHTYLPTYLQATSTTSDTISYTLPPWEQASLNTRALITALAKDGTILAKASQLLVKFPSTTDPQAGMADKVVRITVAKPMANKLMATQHTVKVMARTSHRRILRRIPRTLKDTDSPLQGNRCTGNVPRAQVARLPVATRSTAHNRVLKAILPRTHHHSLTRWHQTGRLVSSLPTL
jgi:hypothetical protein